MQIVPPTQSGETPAAESPRTTASNEAKTEKRRQCMSIAIAEVSISVIAFGLGLATFFHTSNLSCGGFWPHILFVLGGIALIVGCYMHKKGRAWILTGIVFHVIGLFMAFPAILIDGVEASHIAKTTFADCAYSSDSGTANCGRSAFTVGLVSTNCEMSFAAKSCYCCSIYKENSCESYGFSLSTQPTEYSGVASCDSISGTFQGLLWATITFSVLNSIAAVLGIVFANFYLSSISSVFPELVMTRPAMSQMVTEDGHIVFFTTPSQHVAMVPSGSTSQTISYSHGPMITSHGSEPVAQYSHGPVTTSHGPNPVEEPKIEQFPSPHPTLPAIGKKPKQLPKLETAPAVAPEAVQVKTEEGGESKDTNDAPPPYSYLAE
ncbi:unnamed protein product [Owenia fusiformis]|uniref:Uncharacterized protein n=1 Tax=Owenia fusiformis TaxID=6347 RepID=A0A8J1U8C4_OWEFU|nr:unnamed protein product [Owenia fusiformis]